jgi:hypothetical protein
MMFERPVHGFGNLVGNRVRQFVTEGQMHVGHAIGFFELQAAFAFDLLDFGFFVDAVPFDRVVDNVFGGQRVKFDFGAQRSDDHPMAFVLTGAFDRFDTADEFGEVLEVLPEGVYLSNGRFDVDGFVNGDHGEPPNGLDRMGWVKCEIPRAQVHARGDAGLLYAGIRTVSMT